MCALFSLFFTNISGSCLIAYVRCFANLLFLRYIYSGSIRNEYLKGQNIYTDIPGEPRNEFNKQ